MKLYKISILFILSLPLFAIDTPCGTNGENEMYAYWVEEVGPENCGPILANKLGEYYYSDIDPVKVKSWLPSVTHVTGANVYHADGLFTPREKKDVPYFCQVVRSHPGFKYENFDVKLTRVNELNMVFRLEVQDASGEFNEYTSIQQFKSERDLNASCEKISHTFEKNKKGLAEFIGYASDYFGKVSTTSIQYLLANTEVKKLKFKPGHINMRFENGKIRKSDIVCFSAEMDLTQEMQNNLNHPTFVPAPLLPGELKVGNIY